MIQLGSKVRDRYTGFTGTVTCRAEYIDSKARCAVESDTLQKGKPVEQWFDEARLEEIEGEG